MFFNIFKEASIFLLLRIRVVSWFCVECFAFHRQAELKPACTLLLVLTVTFFRCPDFLIYLNVAEPALCLSSVKEPYCWRMRVNWNLCAWNFLGNRRSASLLEKKRVLRSFFCWSSNNSQRFHFFFFFIFYLIVLFSFRTQIFLFTRCEVENDNGRMDQLLKMAKWWIIAWLRSLQLIFCF